MRDVYEPPTLVEVDGFAVQILGRPGAIPVEGEGTYYR